MQKWKQTQCGQCTCDTDKSTVDNINLNSQTYFGFYLILTRPDYSHKRNKPTNFHNCKIIYLIINSSCIISVYNYLLMFVFWGNLANPQPMHAEYCLILSHNMSNNEKRQILPLQVILTKVDFPPWNTTIGLQRFPSRQKYTAHKRIYNESNKIKSWSNNEISFCNPTLNKSYALWSKGDWVLKAGMFSPKLE